MNDIRNYRNKASKVIVSLHWGAEHINKPSPAQKTIARSLISAGADLILGHHSHMVQGIEKYRNGLIVYSLGNFVFDKYNSLFHDSYILEISLGEKIEYKIHPIVINEQYQPTIMPPNRASEFKKYISRLSSELASSDNLNYESQRRKYITKVIKIRSDYRKSLRIYFIKNIYKYSVSDIFRIILYYLKKRRIISKKVQ